MLAPAARLRRRSDFAATVRGGRRAARGAVVVHLRSGASAATTSHDLPARVGTTVPSRAGFVISRAVGGAVERNRVRRRLRHLVRARLGDLPPGTDLVVRALPGAAEASFDDLGTDLTAALAAAASRRSGSRS